MKDADAPGFDWNEVFSTAWENAEDSGEEKQQEAWNIRFESLSDLMDDESFGNPRVEDAERQYHGDGYLDD